jgi:hypothetical protein
MAASTAAESVILSLLGYPQVRFLRLHGVVELTVLISYSRS